MIYLADQTKFFILLTYTLYSVLVHTLSMLSVVCEKYDKIVKAWSNTSVVMHLQTWFTYICFWKMSFIWTKLYLTMLCRESIMYLLYCISMCGVFEDGHLLSLSSKIFNLLYFEYSQRIINEHLSKGNYHFSFNFYLLWRIWMCVQSILK